MQTYLNGTKAQMEAFMQLPLEGPLMMLNLLKFKKDGGEAQYKTYMQAAQPFLAKAKGKVVFYGIPQATLIGPAAGNEWDKVLIVQYDTKEQFLKMGGDPDYPIALRNAALEDSRLICCIA